MRMRSASAVLLSCVLFLVGCGCGPSSAVTTPATPTISISISPSATQTVDASQSYVLTATVSNDTNRKGVTWSVSSGGGSLSNTTTAATTYTAPTGAVTGVTITATSIADTTKSASVMANVNATPTITSTSPLPAGYVGVAYSTTIVASGGTGTRTFGVASGTLPAGLTLNAATGVLSGTPTAAGTSTFTLQVTDSAGTPVTTTKQFTLTVSAMSITAVTLPGDIVGTAYPSTQLSTTGNVGTVTYAVTSGSLPAGLTLSTTGVISGTPTAAGTSSFVVTATDSAGQKATLTLSIVTAGKLTLSNVTLPSVTVNTAITSYQFQATGGTSPYTYTSGSLPAGLSLTSAGVLSGTPTAAGTYTFSVTATDSGSTTSGSATPARQTATAQVTLTVNAATATITIMPTPLPNAIPNSPYSQTLTASGGTAPYTFSLVSGTLPTGVSLASNGVVDGQPTAAVGTYTFTVQATDANSLTGTQLITLNVSTALTPGVNNSLLHGNYAFVFTGYGNGTGGTTTYGSAAVGQLIFDGVGSVTGTIDSNTSTTGFNSAVSLTGSYRIVSDDRGLLVFTPSGASVPTTMTISVSGLNSGVASQFRLLEFDSQDPGAAAGTTGNGLGALQTGTYGTVAPTGSYVFAENGETCSSCNTSTTDFGPLAQVGSVTFTGGLVVPATGELDTRLTTNLRSLVPGGTITLPTGTSGRGTIALTDPNTTSFTGQPLNYVFYAVSPSQFFILSADPHNSGYALLSGTATLSTTGSLSGNAVAYISGNLAGDGATTYSKQVAARVQRFVTTGTTVTTSGYQNVNGTYAAATAGTGATYTSNTTLNTVQFTDTDGTPYNFYMTGANSGYSLGLGTVRGVVNLESQSTTTFSAGLYTFATIPTSTIDYGFLGATNMTATSATAGTVRESEYYVLYDGSVGNRLYRVPTPITQTYNNDNSTGFVQVGTTGDDLRGFVVSGNRFVTILDQPVANTPVHVFDK